MSSGSASAPFRLADITRDQRRTLLAAALGWALDSFDVMLYAMVLTHVMRDLGMTKSTAGLLNTLTLLASGTGGILFGFIADRIGRKRALMASILTYSICSFASGLATSILVLAIIRFILGLGMGGEWNTGAALVAETWPTQLRAKALSIVQGSWAVGYAVAALVAGVMLSFVSWRYVFFVGIAPALVTLWIRRDVPESEMWKSKQGQSDSAENPVPFSRIFSPEFRRPTLVLFTINFLAMFAWWGLFTWIPPYLSLPVSQGGRGFGVMGTTTLLVVLNLFGMLPGYLCYGWVADRIGRRRGFIVYFLIAALLIPLYAIARNPVLIMVLGMLVAFFGTGYFAGSGIAGSELFPTQVRARALGFTYSGARTLSAVAPYVIGHFGETRGLESAFFLCAGAFFLAALVTIQLPETLGKPLQ